jgi:hypothetical protein
VTDDGSCWLVFPPPPRLLRCLLTHNKARHFHPSVSQHKLGLAWSAHARPPPTVQRPQTSALLVLVFPHTVALERRRAGAPAVCWCGGLGCLNTEDHPAGLGIVQSFYGQERSLRGHRTVTCFA